MACSYLTRAHRDLSVQKTLPMPEMHTLKHHVFAFYDERRMVVDTFSKSENDERLRKLDSKRSEFWPRFMKLVITWENSRLLRLDPKAVVRGKTSRKAGTIQHFHKVVCMLLEKYFESGDDDKDEEFIELFALRLIGEYLQKLTFVVRGADVFSKLQKMAYVLNTEGNIDEARYGDWEDGLISDGEDEYEDEYEDD